MGSGGGVTRRAVILEEDVINDCPEHILKYLHTLLWLLAEVHGWPGCKGQSLRNMAQTLKIVIQSVSEPLTTLQGNCPPLLAV